MITFKAYLVEMSSKKNKKRSAKDLILSIPKGNQFGMVGAGKSGLMQADRKDFKRKSQRKEGKEIAKRAMRDDY